MMSLFLQHNYHVPGLTWSGTHPVLDAVVGCELKMDGYRRQGKLDSVSIS